MRLSNKKFKEVLRNKGITLKDVLQDAGVSKTAFYSLLKKESVLPDSLQKLAQKLGVSALSFLEDPFEIQEKTKRQLLLCQKIVQENPQALWENVWHTLQLLEEPPLNRLARSLRRGQARSK